jgi:hypothetical protein
LTAVADEPDIRFAGFLQDAQKEYAEANLTYWLVSDAQASDQPLPTPGSLGVEDAPFLLLAPSRHFLRPLQEDLLRRRQACFLPLDESIGMLEHGRLAATEDVKRAIDRFRQRVIPVSGTETSAVFFPTPAGTGWSQVQIRLVDGHTASIVVGTAHGVYNFAQMGMANMKSGNPSVQWELLKAFAAGYGIITWRSRQADRRNQKRRELLARSLREFFRIDSDPFLPHDNGWRARFTVSGPG